MIKELRHRRILSILRRDGAVDMAALAQLMPDVSKVTLRRDVAELADAGALRRTHGGAVLPDAAAIERAARVVRMEEAARAADLDTADAVILPPIPGRGADALRRQIVRRGLPFLAESAPQPGGRYIGPDNAALGRELGRLAGRATTAGRATILEVCVSDLANTRERAAGFDAGFREAFAGEVSAIRVNGQGMFSIARRVASAALRENDDVTVAFAVNDHSAYAVLEAAEREGRDLDLYAAGGESPDLVAHLGRDGPLRAVAALFPEAVGAIAIDRAAAMILGERDDAPVVTPHAVVTPENLTEFYRTEGEGLALRPDVLERLTPATADRDERLRGRRIAFLPHFPAHDWYRLMIQAMEDRAADRGMELMVAPPHEGIAREIARLRRAIAEQAAEGVVPGQTLILGHGETMRQMAQALRRRIAEEGEVWRGTIAVTNALPVLTDLTGAPGLKVILTPGEYQEADRCLVGPSLGALFERLRADVAYLTVDGVTAGFGLSSVDERLALVGGRFAAAARRVVALADHVAVGADANHRIIRAAEVHEVITDDGALPEDRARLAEAGIAVTLAGEADGPAPGSRETNRTRRQGGTA